MNQSSQKVISYLTGQPTLNSLTVDELKAFVLESPFFPINQLLLVKKLKEENEHEYILQLQKTALYFPNQYWLQTQLNDDFFTSFGELEPFTVINNTDTEASAGADETELIIADSSIIKASPAITVNDEILLEKDVLSSTVTEGKEDADDSSQNAVDHKENERFTETATHAELPAEEMEVVATETEADPFAEIPKEAAPEVVELEEEMAGVSLDIDLNTTRFLEELESRPRESEEPELDDEHDKMFQNIKAMLDASSEEADADTRNAVIAIDPYYTIDYFASQGIKLELDKNPTDQLGQNLRKFTHWLRHMKKLGPEDATELINQTETEADIQQIADSSNTVREVVTEAMASVLEKQGKKDKAIELYNKLSFLDPRKSAYFADKINKLKGF